MLADNGLIYSSRTDGNSGNDPLSDPVSWKSTTFTTGWGTPVTSSSGLDAGVNSTNDVSGGEIIRQMPVVLAIGDEFMIECFDAADTGNTVIIDRNGHTIRDRGIDIDQSGDGNLVLESGDFVRLVAVTTAIVEIVK